MNAHWKLVKNNAKSILKIIAKYYKCNHTFALYQILKQHPDFPSFLSLQYILQRIGKESFALHISYNDLHNLPLPAIIHITTNIDIFLFITKVTQDEIQVLNEKGTTENILKSDLIRMWDGNILLIDKSQGNINIPFQDKFKMFITLVKYPSLLLSIISLLGYILIVKQEYNITFFLYLSGIISGVLTSILLFIEQIDRHNIHIKKLCSPKNIHSNIDCSSILEFKDAYFLGIISWSDLGFIYFTFLFSILLILPFTISQTVINIFSFLCIGYVCYSLYYQKLIAKKWCTLCLFIQAIFIYLFILSFYTFNFKNIHELFQVKYLSIIILTAINIITLYSVIKSLIKSHKQYSSLKKKRNRLLYNENIFQHLLKQEFSVSNFRDVNQIRIGHLEADTYLTLIFNPTCISCIKELQTLLTILSRKKEIQLRMIFLLDMQKHPESLIIAEKLLSKYNHPKDNFMLTLQDYVNNYPISKNQMLKRKETFQEETLLEEIIIVHNKWCLKNKINNTPTLFINNNKIPEYYEIQDLDYLYN